MALRTFAPGQRVSVSPIGQIGAPGGFYNIVRALPAAPGPTQYRVKNDAEPFERIIDEGRLTAIDNV